MELSQIDTFGLHVLCIDDSKSQLSLYKSQLEAMYQTTCAETYQEAVACLSAFRPDLIILDMTMPQVSGLEFLDILRYTPNYAHIPVIIVSGDNNPSDIKEAFRRGAADYVKKPYDDEELLLRINRIFQLSGKSRGDKKENSGSLNSAQELLIQSLADLASAKDNENTRHLERIGLYARELASAASRLPRFRTIISADFIEKIGSMARLHDIGKVNIPDYILHKTEPLTEREFDHIKKHTTDGARTIDMIRLSFPDYAFLDFARDIILSHHEHWDGTGYPEGRKGTDIALSARITAIAEVFDALTINRIYREAVPPEEAYKTIVGLKGKFFDPDLIEATNFCKSRFFEVFEKNRD